MRGVLLDFHHTLVHGGAVADWVDRVGGATLDAALRTRVVDVVATVWARAARRWPGATWDLSPEAHRTAFTGVLEEDAGCPGRLAHALYDAMPDQWRLAPGARGLLEDLRGHDVRLALVSNIGIDVRPALARLGVLDLLDAVVLSSEVGMVKPDPAIFRAAAAALGLDPVDCLMVGDSPETDGGASRVGMPTLLVPTGPEGPRLDGVQAFCLGGTRPGLPRSP